MSVGPLVCLVRLATAGYMTDSQTDEGEFARDLKSHFLYDFISNASSRNAVVEDIRKGVTV